jgi:HTH-type transcriptional repressor of NAD biosynthesis genes
VTAARAPAPAPEPEEGRFATTGRFAHGLVIGKFYPPHAGHDFLIRSAAAFCELVTVLVLGASVESLSVEARVRWLGETHAQLPHVRVAGGTDDVRIDYEDAAVWDAHLAIIRTLLEELIGPVAVDAVFTSEPYGAELARRLDAADVRLDEARGCVEASASVFRADPVGSFEMVAPAVRGGLARRVVVLGAESTGTTTLSRDLASALRARGGTFSRTCWVAEYGREYSQAKLAVAQGASRHRGEAVPGLADLVWTATELEHIAAEQLAREEEAARIGGPVLVCDTDALATVVWHERYVGEPSAAMWALVAQAPPRALYLLTSHADVPFEDDGLRDGEHLREAMTTRFRQVLQGAGVPFVEIAGTRAERLEAALAAVGEIAGGWHFADPLGAGE